MVRGKSKMAGKKKTITFVTGNSNKLKEVEAILGKDFPYEFIARDIDLPEYQGHPDTVSRLKCKSAFEIIQGPVIVDDTCLCFNALGGLPGPYIKWFAASIGPSGLFKMLKGFDDHSAYAMATMTYYDGESDLQENIQFFKGITKGTIVEPRGICGFAWNSCFLPDGYDKTYAEMSAEEKNQMSHRKMAIEAMRIYFNNTASENSN